MYDTRPNLIIGFHGCERQVRDKLLMNPNDYIISQKPYDWLGHGFYFWENNYDRALQWATEKQERGIIKEPSVIGAVLYLGYCCDLLDKRYIKLLAGYFNKMKDYSSKLQKELPKNKDVKDDAYKNKLLRNLDCSVIEYMHEKIQQQVQSDLVLKGYSPHKIFDSTRGVFIEGGPAFEGAGIFEKTHIQICIRNPNCIQGFFLPRQETDFMDWLAKKAA
ncbi:MAG: hypothetical protein JST68_04710 [Bacteroidetes bacterium]|nr:hypothetical protein [Bacteroidota bacterium]